MIDIQQAMYDLQICPWDTRMEDGCGKFGLRLRLWKRGEEGRALSELSDDYHVDFFETPVTITPFTTYKSFVRSLANAMSALADSVEKRYNAQEYEAAEAEADTDEDPYGPELAGDA